MWAKVALHSNRIKSNKKISHWWEIAFWLFGVRNKKKNATSNLRGCFVFESNQTQKTITHWWEIAFWLFVAKNKKRMQQATSGVGQGCFAFESNQTQKNLSSLRDCILFLCWWKTKKWMQQATSEVALHLNQIEYKKQSLIDERLHLGCFMFKSNQTQKTISHRWEIAFCLFVGKKQKKWMQQATSEVALHLNQIKHTKNNLSLMRDCILFVCWQKTKNECNKQTLVWIDIIVLMILNQYYCIISNQYYHIISNRCYRVDDIKSILLYRWYWIDIILSILNQYYCINDIKSILSYQYQINIIIVLMISNQYYHIDDIESILSYRWYWINIIISMISNQYYCINNTSGLV